MINRHNVVKFIFAILFLAVTTYFYNLFTNEKVKNDEYANITDLSAAYRADEEIAKAEKLLASGSVDAATVITHTVDGKRELSLTFDGLPRKTTADRLLDVLEAYKAPATFFAEGSNAAADPSIIEAIEERGQTIGNYTFIGLAKLEQIPQNEVVKQLCKTQKVLTVTSQGTTILFKAPKTRFDVPLLKVAAACGLKSAVKTDTFIIVDDIVSDEVAEQVVQNIKPGSVVSIVVNRALELITQKEGKIDDRPAVDKQPSVNLNKAIPVKHEDIVEVTERLLAACKKQGIAIVPLSKMRTVHLVKPAQSTAEQVISRVSMLLEDSLKPKIAYAAESYTKLREQNGGVMAEELKMILTTEQAIAFSFTGFSKPEATNAVLDRMKKFGMHGTFFVGVEDIKRNPQLVKRIIAEQHELGIAVYDKKSSNFDTACHDIEQTKTLLKNNYGVETDLVKQPWGIIPDYLKEAVSAMRCHLIGHNVNVVQTKHKDYTSANNILPEIFGRFVYSCGRGWIINFRMDYYDDPLLCADIMQLIKEQKVDNIAYWSFDDVPQLNLYNDSAYSIKSVGAVLNNKKYTYKLPAENIPWRLRHENNRVQNSGETFWESVRKRYIGTPTVNIDSNTLGFAISELRNIDTSGIVHTNKPVVFLSFDDWGTDAPINQLLYVLRKHNVKGCFFILARNVKSNPNLLRAIAAEGHDIASHTNNHKPMAVVGKREKLYAVQTREETLTDLQEAYAELERITGDVVVDGKPSLTKYFRPPTLTISKMGFEEIFSSGYEYIISGSTSTHDYEAKNLYEMIDNIRLGLYEDGKVKKGAVFVMHMSDASKFTARALDILLTLNEQKADDDPTKFIVGRLSEYLVDGYDQSRKEATLKLEMMRGQ